MAGIRAQRSERLHWTVIGHSYGSLVTGMAESQQGLGVSRGWQFPAVFATADPGSTFALQVFRQRGEAVLSGGTPCLPDPQP